MPQRFSSTKSIFLLQQFKFEKTVQKIKEITLDVMECYIRLNLDLRDSVSNDKKCLYNSLCASAWQLNTTVFTDIQNIASCRVYFRYDIIKEKNLQKI